MIISRKQIEKNMATKQEFKVKVIKSEVVTAEVPVREHWLPQSSLDLIMPTFDVGVIFCYKKPSSGYTFASMVSVLKKSLAQTLASYFAFAGEMLQNVAEKPELLCNNRGVDFVEAIANIEVQELNLYNPDESIEGKLVPKKKQGVLAVQATEFECGGLVIGCAFDHRVADAYSANMFFVSWAEIAQSRQVSVLPSFCRSLLSPRRPGGYGRLVNELYTVTNLKLPPPKEETNGINDHQEQTSRIYYVKAEQIHQLQSLANDGNQTEELKRTKLEAFSAFLWKIIALGAHEGDKCSELGIVVDGRTRLGDGDEHQSKLMSVYFGNVISVAAGEMKNKELKEMPLSFIANEVHKFLQGAVTKEHFLEVMDYVEEHRPHHAIPKIYVSRVTKEEPALVVSSGQRFPIRNIDFGWGKPIFGSCHFPWGAQAGYVMPMPSASGNGDWIVYIYSSKDQIEVIEENAAHVLKPLTQEYLFSI